MAPSTGQLLNTPLILLLKRLIPNESPRLDAFLETRGGHSLTSHSHSHSHSHTHLLILLLRGGDSAPLSRCLKYYTGKLVSPLLGQTRPSRPTSSLWQNMGVKTVSSSSRTCS